MSKDPFLCGNCGARFATKGEKRRHKLACPSASELSVYCDNDDDPADWYGRHRNTPEVKARAAAEWAAMDAYGRLPDGWEWNPDFPKAIDQAREQRKGGA